MFDHVTDKVVVVFHVRNMGKDVDAPLRRNDGPAELLKKLYHKVSAALHFLPEVLEIVSRLWDISCQYFLEKRVGAGVHIPV